MKRLYFTCELLSDVILNQRAATSGNQQTLDFIPGNNFLGIVASTLYNDANVPANDKLRLFHTGEVRYGDAHPMLNGIRTLRVPASMFYPKGEKVSDRCFIHHGYNRDHDNDKLQLKQCRTGFYAFANGQAEEMSINTSFAIKSAYDSAKRRSEDERMYGYESLPKGLIMAFDVELDESASHLAEPITRALTGKHRVGRSRSAQYGLVVISQADESVYPTPSHSQLNVCTVYADSRLIFIDSETGEPTFRPTAIQLGLAEGVIDWKNSQVRTFQYAPWNGKRMTRDADRCGIEKGSVFVVKDAKSVHTESKYVGNYQNEGFGRVVYQPAFLDFIAETNGKAVTRIVAPQSIPQANGIDIQALLASDSHLLQYMGRKQQRINELNKIYEMVNQFVAVHQNRFRDESFASQWGGIRAIATRMCDSDASEIWKAVKDFLTRGTAAEKWNQNGRLIYLSNFASKLIEEKHCLLREALVNLGAEMAKKAKKGGKR